MRDRCFRRVQAKKIIGRRLISEKNRWWNYTPERFGNSDYAHRPGILRKWNRSFRSKYKRFMKREGISFEVAKNVLLDEDDFEMLTSAQIAKVKPKSVIDNWDWR